MLDNCATCGQRLLIDAQTLRFPSVIDKVRSRHLPDRPERAAIRDALAEQCRLVTELDNEVAYLREKIRVERAVLVRSVHEYRTLLAPIRRLPAEILSEVLVQCVDNFSETQRSQQALRLSHVSAFWRETSLCTASLWQSVVLSPKMADFVAFQLSLTVPRPVVTFIGENSGLGELVDKHMERIQRMIVDGLAWADLLQSPSGPSALEELCFTQTPLNRLDGVRCSYFQDAPLLGTLTIKSWCWQSHHFDLPWAQLKNCQIGDLHPESCLELLSKISTLDKLTLASRHLSACDARRPGVPLISINLVSLELSFCPSAEDRDPNIGLISFFSFPLLRCVSVRQMRKRHQPAFVSLMAHSAQSVTILRATNCQVTTSQVIHILETLPMLEELHLDNRTTIDSDALFAFLEQSTTSVPNLRSLTFGQNHSRLLTEPKYERSLVDVVRARWSAAGDFVNYNRCLSQVVLHIKGDRSDIRPLRELLSLHAEGFDVSVFHETYGRHGHGQRTRLVPTV